MKSGKVISCSPCLVLFSTTVFAHSRLKFDDARMFDQYGNILWDDEKARLDNVAVFKENLSLTIDCQKLKVYIKSLKGVEEAI